MNAIDLLLNRQSQPRLQAPAPAGEALQIIQQAALRAPDHAGLTPWQFVIIEGDGLERLGQLFIESVKARGGDQESLARAPLLPKRSPMIIAAATRYTDHPKVPRVEQVQSAACAVHAMQMAAFAQGFSGIWRTGSYAQCDVVKQGLGFSSDEELVGFLYLGSSPISPRQPPKRSADDYFSHWR
ncbi:NAD(P)H nitroreductase [Alteromonas sp. ASW11-36]|uniref:Putative NAD(P)H nitroreductase n=1 Tax=Alteromonas arenosi TaxID=3055817 RepID=A0ABT7SYI9_9ALTE|nr:NAD(P)H nitroreductase [Alteromonas sp. ASW11-36]MDM7860594.1 NAD(P)H nitroreductase [Alteromonas sp. ASW11-36]